MSKDPQPSSAKGKGRGTFRAGFFFGSLSFLGTAVLGFVSTIITARLFGISLIGAFTLASAPANILFVLSTIKEQQALIREITGLPPRHPRVTQLFAAVFTFSWALTLVISALDVIVCWFVFRGPLNRPDLFAPALANIAGYAVITNTGWNLDSILSAFVAGRELFWARLCEAASYVIFAVVAGVLWKSIWGLVIATTAASLLALFVRVWMVRRYVTARLSWQEYRLGLGVLPGLLPFGLRATPGQMAQGISQQAGSWALGLIASNSVVGAYSRALSIPQRLQQASLRVTEVLYPTLVGRKSKGDGHGFDRALIDSIRYEVVGMLLLAAALGGAARSVLNIFGPGFSQAAPALVLLALYPALASITVAQTQALWAVDKPGTTSIISIARMTLSLVLLAVLTSPLGIVGPAIALLSGYAAGVILCGLALRSHLTRPLRATWPIREWLAVGLAYGAGFLSAHLVEGLLPSLLGTPVALAAGAGAFVLTFVIAGGLNQRDRQRLGQLVDWARIRFRRPKAPPQSEPA